ncbi:MAG: NUDIX domain-containing protein, partial [Anaerolineaceae bacterium]|nr:NUDIX domain-containing protein [Anaerolineaceae bacterium]
YRVIPRTLIFLFSQDRVLLLKGAPGKHLWANRYNGLGGHIERGEDVLSAARRELAEEAGICVPNLRLCGTIMVDAGEETGIGIYVFRGEYTGDAPADSPDGSLEWIERHRLGEIDLIEDLPDLLSRLFSRETEAPFSARSFYNEDGKIQIIFS